MVVDGPRACRADEMPAMCELVNEVFDPELQRMGAWFPTLLSAENPGYQSVVWADGRPVSFLGVQVSEMHVGSARLNVGRIGAVCTHADYRARGFAEAVLHDAMAHCSAAGVDLFYISGDRSLYRRHGAVRCGQTRLYTLTVDNVPRQPGIEVVPFTAAHLGGWIALHQREPVRFQRTHAVWCSFLRPPMANWLRAPAIYRTVCVDGVPQAYLMLVRYGTAGNVVEAGGSRRLIAAALAEVLRDEGFDRITWRVPASDLETQVWGREAGIAGEPGPYDDTVTVLNWAQIGTRLRPHLEERLTRAEADRLVFAHAEGWWGIQYGEASFGTPEWGDASRLLFGPPPGEPAVALPAGALGEVLARVLPLPRPQYGMSYI